MSDFEYRVWTQYILSADDFGVMRASGVTLQADNDALAAKRAPVVQRALDAVVKVGLLHTFDHQDRRYVYQRDWQTWQKVEWPRLTTAPKPPADVIGTCDAPTIRLFTLYPGGQRKGKTGQFSLGRSESSREVPGKSPESSRQELATTRARAPAKRLMAMAKAEAMAFGEGVETPFPPLDVWLRELQGKYPPQAVTSGHTTELAFVAVFDRDDRPADVVFADILAHLEQQTRGYQWAVKRMIPKLERWLREGLWQQFHDEQPPTALVSEQTLHTAMAADAFEKGGGNGTR